MKRYAAMLLSILLLLGLFVPQVAAAEESAKATTLRITATEGTVTLANANGRSLTIREDMKLYSGYTVKTGKSSYAYISLDDTKAIKLDASTTVEVRKSGKKLEVLVSAGQIFFNVTAPLKDDEKLEIRTSTIVTGIRGTSGIINYVDESTSTLSLLDGSVVMQAIDPETGASVEMPVQAGQVAVASKANTAASQPKVALAPLEHTDVPGFAATEIAKDTQLQEKIAQQSKLDVELVVKTANETLKQEQKKEEEAAKEVAQAVAKEENKAASAPIPSGPPAPSVAPVIPVPSMAPVPSTHPSPTPAPSIKPTQAPADDDHDDDYEPRPTPTAVPTPKPTPKPAPTPTPYIAQLTGAVAAAKIAGFLNSNDTVVIQPTGEVKITGNFAIPAGKELVITGTGSQYANKVHLEAGSNLTVSGTLRISADGLLSNSGTLLVNGTLTLESRAHLSNGADGTLNLEDSDSRPLKVTASSNSQIGNKGTIMLTLKNAKSTLVNQTTIELSSSGIVIASGPTGLLSQLNMSGAHIGITGSDATSSAGFWCVSFPSVQTETIKLHINDALENKSSTIYLSPSAGTITFPYDLVINDDLNERLTIDLNGGTLVMAEGKTITNQGTLVISDSGKSAPGALDLNGGQLSNQGTLEIRGGTITSNDSTVTLINGKPQLPQESPIACEVIHTGGTISNTGAGAVIQNYATLTVDGGTIRGGSGRETVSNSDRGTVTVRSGLIENTENGYAISNQSTVTIEQNGTVKGPTGIFLSGNSAVVSVTGGVVDGTQFGIAVAADATQYKISISGGTVQAKETANNSYAVNGTFTLSDGGVVRAKGTNTNNYGVCDTIPAGYEISPAADAEGFYQLVTSP